MNPLYELITQADGKRYRVEFRDGDRQNVLIVSTTHVMLDNTVLALPLTQGGTPVESEPGVQFVLEDVTRVLDFVTNHLLFPVA